MRVLGCDADGDVEAVVLLVNVLVKEGMMEQAMQPIKR
jgi:hypothetical protein